MLSIFSHSTNCKVIELALYFGKGGPLQGDHHLLGSLASREEQKDK